MEHQLWQSIVQVLHSLHKAPTPTRCDFSDDQIVRVFYWAVIHDRPTRWACHPTNWPLWRRRPPLPSHSHPHQFDGHGARGEDAEGRGRVVGDAMRVLTLVDGPARGRARCSARSGSTSRSRWCGPRTTTSACPR